MLICFAWIKHKGDFETCLRKDVKMILNVFWDFETGLSFQIHLFFAMNDSQMLENLFKTSSLFLLLPAAIQIHVLSFYFFRLIFFVSFFYLLWHVACCSFWLYCSIFFYLSFPSVFLSFFLFRSFVFFLFSFSLFLASLQYFQPYFIFFLSFVLINDSLLYPEHIFFFHAEFMHFFQSFSYFSFSSLYFLSLSFIFLSIIVQTFFSFFLSFIRFYHSLQSTIFNPCLHCILLYVLSFFYFSYFYFFLFLFPYSLSFIRSFFTYLFI